MSFAICFPDIPSISLSYNSVTLRIYLRIFYIIMAFKVFGDLLNVHDLFHIVKFLEDRPFKFPYDCRQIECSCFCNVLVCLFSQVDHYPYISCNNLIWTWLLNLYSYLSSLISSNGVTGVLSLSFVSSSAISFPTRSGLVHKSWPNLT